jgi:hypothetical protein
LRNFILKIAIKLFLAINFDLLKKLLRLNFSFLYKKVGKKEIPLPVIIWFALALIAVLAELFHQQINNYSIFKYVFWHVLHKENLYLEYPALYEDSNHYGPLFSFIIAPFAILPDWLGVILWVLFNAWFLYYAITKLPLTSKSVLTILLITVVELMTASHNVQFNPMMTAWIILSYVMVHKGKDFWATFFIVAGFLIKLYGIVGILFFVFSKHKGKFVGSFLFWLMVLFALPMVISSPAFIIQTYQDWFHSLTEKNLHNISLDYVSMTDLSAMGLIRRIFKVSNLSNLVVIIPAVILLALPLLRLKLYRYKVFQLSYLALCLISVVIYSSGSESPTFVIAVVGIAIWFVTSNQASRFNISLLLFAIFLTSLSSTDLFPRFIRQTIILPYALKALPSCIVWLVLIAKVGLAGEDSFKTAELHEAEMDLT